MNASLEQQRQNEWNDQWKIFQNQEHFLFLDWIRPYDMEVFRGRQVLECGCGGGQHTDMMAEVAAHVTAVDLNTTPLARETCRHRDNVTFVEADIAAMDLGPRFDVVISIGVVHHTDAPERTVANLRRHLKPGGVLIVWVYAREGNAMVRLLVEPFRKIFLRRLPRWWVLQVSRLMTLLLYPFVYTIYLLPLRFLPFYEYFGNFRRMSFNRNLLNVFDKLNAPQVDFISHARAEAFVEGLERPSVLPYVGVSWTVSGVRPLGDATET